VFVYSSPVESLPGAFVIHLDDQISGFHIYGNVFYRIAHGVIRLGGGRDTIIENNVFHDAGWAVHIDNRGMGWQKKATRNGTLWKRLQEVDYTKPPWSERYPELVDIVEDRLGEPVDNVVRRNIFSQKGVLYNIGRVPADRTTIDWNLAWRGGNEVLVRGTTYGPPAGGLIPFEEWQKLGFDTHSVIADPLLLAPEEGDMRLHPESPAFALGFKPIPYEEIGLRHDPWRSGPLPPTDKRRMSSEPVTEEYPIPGFVPEPQRELEQVRIPQSDKTIAIDGVLTPGEWDAGNVAVLQLTADYKGMPVKYPSTAWVTHDGNTLYVAVSSTVSPAAPVTKTASWGQDDAVEIALQDVSGERPGPVFVLRAYPSGHVVSVDDAGAPPAAVQALGKAATFAATTPEDGQWDAEWAIPLNAMGVAPPRPAHSPCLRFNVTVRKAASREWVMWRPTNGNSWLVERTGIICLEPTGGG
jgi:hypothetical protein